MFVRRRRSVSTLVAVFLAGLLASRPVAAEGDNEPAVSPPGHVFVEINSSSRPVRLDRVIAPGVTAPVCVSPCRQVLPRDGTYLITGDGVRPTSPFVLSADRDRVVLDVKPGSSRTASVGVVAGWGGLALMLVGLVAMGARDWEDSWDSSRDNKKGPSKTTAGYMAIGGLMAGIVGFCLYFGSKTSVTSSAGIPGTPAPKPNLLNARGLAF